MQKWEYKIIDTKKLAEAKWFKSNRVSAEDAQAYLNQLGEEGWEILDIDFDGIINDTRSFAGIAKRPKGV